MDKMTLTGYYESLSSDSPRTIFKKQVIEKCKISNATFHNWMSGRWPVPEEAQSIIATIAKKTREELFSNK